MRPIVVLTLFLMIFLLSLSTLMAQTPPRILVQKLELEDGDILDIVTNTGNTHAADYILRALHVETGAMIGTDTGETLVENLRINQVDAGFVAAIVNQSAFPSAWPAGHTLRIIITFLPTNEVSMKNIIIPTGTTAIILTDPEDVMIVPPYQGSVSPNPSAATNPQPIDNAVDVATDLSVLGWSYLSNQSFTDPIGFRIYLNTTGIFEINDPYEWVYYITEQQDYQNSSILPVELSYETTYYWKVVPTTIDPNLALLIDSENYATAPNSSRLSDYERGDASNLPIWSFTTEDSPFMPFAGGSGTPESPYLIATAEQLNYVRDYLSYHFRQIDNINLGVAPWNIDTGWQSIGTLNNSFTGVYDGDSFTTINLTINRPTVQYQGLFGETDNALIKNVVLENVNVTGQNRTGGIVGQNKASTIQNCMVDGSVTGSWFVGGITGYNMNNSIISNCQSSATVSGTQSVGGLIGLQNNSTTSGSGATGNVSNTGIYTGGLIGSNSNNSNISQSSASGNVTGGANAGGLVGYNTANSTVSRCFALGNVTCSANYSGGLIGYNGNSVINDSYAIGSVSGNSYTAGFIGYNSSSSLSNCYSIGNITGTTNTGGLVGSQFSSSVTNSYWNIETSGQTNSAGGIGSTTSDMTYPYSVNVYLNWNFNSIWGVDTNYSMNNGYPYLRWQITDVLTTPVVIIQINNGFVVLDWDDVANANSYYIYSSNDPQNVNWGNPIGHVPEPGFTEEVEEMKFYRVIASSEHVTY